MKKQTKYIVFIIFVLIVGGIYYGKKEKVKIQMHDTYNKTELAYNPVVDPEDFVARVDNSFFKLQPGMTFVYESATDEGLEQIEVYVTHEQRDVMGVATTVVRDRVWLDNELIEDTRDWYAQDNEGTVWYFGEEVDNYDDGVLINHDGAWEAGIDGALPGIIMPAHPFVGQSYRQEYYKNKAEDMGNIMALDVPVTVPYGVYRNCLQIRDWSNIDAAANEYKYYCKEVGFLALEESVDNPTEKVELIRMVAEK